jgi:hypothetical protein
VYVLEIAGAEFGEFNFPTGQFRPAGDRHMKSATRKPATRPVSKITSRKSGRTAAAIPPTATTTLIAATTGKKPNAICSCGCGQRTQSPKTRFRMGHDQILKSRALGVARGTITTAVDDLSEALPHQEARDFFHHHLENERRRIAAAAKK